MIYNLTNYSKFAKCAFHKFCNFYRNLQSEKAFFYRGHTHDRISAHFIENVDFVISEKIKKMTTYVILQKSKIEEETILKPVQRFQILDATFTFFSFSLF